ncbi:hypothetical protein AB0H83_40020 [Dactylosporangium sp. NPDC050688]|uniref:hypothetical protein n=1 Tax=Dactylosporangium sp. NPDC050688 TaxID=3157217 RepID=UPI0034090594
MRVTFHRLPDHQWADVLIERDDGVVYRMHAGPVTAHAPHDLVHFTVEDALGMSDGIWGAIAGGVVFRSMTHVSGRRPPHAAERSAELIRANRDRLQRAELIGGFVERAAAVPDADLDRLAAQQGADPLSGTGKVAVRRAVAALRAAQETWAALPVGAQLTLTWPRHRRMVPLERKVQRRGPTLRRAS